MSLISPGVESNEIDLTSTINNQATGRAAIVGAFSWGSTTEIVKVTNESDLVNLYGTPDNASFASFFSAANFLSYGNDLRVLRAVRSDAAAAVDENGPDTANGITAKYVGVYGNKISTEVFTSASTFSTYAVHHPYQLAANELCIVVRLSGSKVESHYCSTNATALDVYNNKLYVQDVLAKNSNYIKHDGSTAVVLKADAYFTGGTDGVATDLDAAYVSAWDAFEDRYSIYANLFISGDAAEVGVSVVTAIKDKMELRQDAIAFLSPTKAAAVDAANVTTAIANIIAHKTTTVNVVSSYCVYDGNYKYQYDKYNDIYRWIPLNGDIAGLCVYTDNVAAPWFSPAGVNRGQIRGVTKLALTTNQAQRDSLYENGINPVVSFAGQGFYLYGDKTCAIAPTAFDRINVRRLFNLLKKSISDSAQFKLFELNDEFTRTSFKAEIDQYLQTIKSQRGINDYFTVIDETNNTAQIIDTNWFVSDIYIKPARSINFIQLNFIATATGVDFQELLKR